MGISQWVRRRCTWWGIPAELLVDREGQRVALLDDRQFHEMFWSAWRITPLTDDPQQRSALLSDDFWKESHLGKTVFRSKQSGDVAHAFWPLSQPVRAGRLILRGAYVPTPVRFWRTPFLWLRLLLLGGGAFDPAREDTSS